MISIEAGHVLEPRDLGVVNVVPHHVPASPDLVVAAYHHVFIPFDIVLLALKVVAGPDCPILESQHLV